MSSNTSLSGGTIALHWTGSDGVERSAPIIAHADTTIRARVEIARDPDTGELTWTASDGVAQDPS